MVKSRGGSQIYGKRVNLESIRLLNGLIPYRNYESITARSDKLAIAVLNKFMGSDWIEKHIANSKKGFLRDDNSTPARREIQRMRRVLLAEMLYNLQYKPGFDSCWGELA